MEVRRAVLVGLAKQYAGDWYKHIDAEAKQILEQATSKALAEHIATSNSIWTMAGPKATLSNSAKQAIAKEASNAFAQEISQAIIRARQEASANLEQRFAELIDKLDLMLNRRLIQEAEQAMSKLIAANDRIATLEARLGKLEEQS